MSTTQPVIVMTTDGSQDSLRAVEPTLALARNLNAQVILLSVVCEMPLPDAAPIGPAPALHSWNRDLEAEVSATRARLEQIAGPMRARLGSDAAVEVAVVRGECPEAVIASLAAVRNAKFIAMASHGRSGLRRLLLGSVTEQVIRRASTPVIVFPVAA